MALSLISLSAKQSLQLQEKQAHDVGLCLLVEVNHHGAHIWYV
jgi:hypothetical protein